MHWKVRDNVSALTEFIINKETNIKRQWQYSVVSTMRSEDSTILIIANVIKPSLDVRQDLHTLIHGTLATL